MSIPFAIICFYAIELIVCIILLVVVFKRRKKEKEKEIFEHKDYKNY